MIPTTYKNLPSEWDSLEQIDTLLNQARLDLSDGTKMLSVQGQTFVFQDIVDKVYALSPSLTCESPRNKPYLSIAKKLKAINEQVPVQQKTLIQRIGNLFSCFGCTASCREDLILSQHGSLTEDDLDDWLLGIELSSS